MDNPPAKEPDGRFSEAKSPTHSEGQFSADPMPLAEPPGSPRVLRGDELCRHVADCLSRGVSKAAICAELIGMGYAASQAEPWVEQFTEAHKKARGDIDLPKFPGA